MNARIRDHLFFEKILRFSHPLCVEIVRSLVLPKPGIYLIRRGRIVSYVGRSSVNLQERLAQHCRNRNYHGSYFSFFYSETAIDAYRLENSAIFYFKRIGQLDNKIHAALPKRK